MISGMADNSEQIEQLKGITQTGITSASVDGLSGSVDIGQAKKSLRELKLQDSESIETGLVRPVVFRTKLGGAW